MSKVGSNKPQILQARVIEMAAQGFSGRRTASALKINRRTVTRILAGPEARAIVIEARERAKQLVGKAYDALHKSLARGSSRTAIAVLRGAGVFESRAEALVRHRYRDEERAQIDLEKLEQKSRREVQSKFGRHLGDAASPEEWARENARLDRLARTEAERKTASLA